MTGATVADWGVAGCAPGASCILPSGTADLVVRLDLTGVVPGTTVPVTVTTSAPGATTATASVSLTTIERPAGLSWFAVDHGGLAMAANTVLTCVGDEATCGKDNNTTDLGYVDIDTGPGDSFNSSSADLALPAGATVSHATLRWGGDPDGAPDPDRLGQVVFTGPDGTPIELPAATVRLDGSAGYTASVDVTQALARLATVNGHLPGRRRADRHRPE